MDEINKNQKLVGVDELAKILNIHKSWIYQQTSKGRGGLPRYKIGKYVRFDVEEVMAHFRQAGKENV